MSSTASNINLYEVIGKLTVWTQSLESDNSALRAELSKNVTYIASLESRVEELLRNPPAANPVRPKWGTHRPKLSHRCNRPEAYPCYEDPYYERMTTEEDEPTSLQQFGRTLVGAFGDILEGVPQREVSYGEVPVPERQVADGCVSCGISVSKGNHDNCNYNAPPLIRQVADGCVSCGISVSEGNHNNCLFTKLSPIERQVADTRWNHEHKSNFFRENDFEKYAIDEPAEEDIEIAEEKILIPRSLHHQRRGLTLSDLAIPNDVVNGKRLG